MVLEINTLGSVLEINAFSGKEKVAAWIEGEVWAAAQSQWRSQPTLKRLKLDGPAELLQVGLYTQHGPVIRCGLLWEGVWLWMKRLSSTKKISIGASRISPSSLKGDLHDVTASIIVVFPHGLCVPENKGRSLNHLWTDLTSCPGEERWSHIRHFPNPLFFFPTSCWPVYLLQKLLEHHS